MTRTSSASFPLIISLAALVLVLVAGSAPNVAKAQVIERGVQGGVAGAIIGGIIGGGRGAGTGAAIGAGVGIITGAAEADANARAAAYDSQYYGAPPPGGPGLVYSIQASLTRLGYNAGPVDGVYGARTADAISQFQYTNRLPVDGRPSPGILNIMISQGG
ncbi:MAG: peptidoglycan-binding domain-containing protein [Methyloceanibacter sp.]